MPCRQLLFNGRRRQQTQNTPVISGDPNKAGSSFVIRYRALRDCDVGPHFHPIDEHITVLEGSFGIGFGEQFDAKNLRTLSAGSYVLAPKNAAHFTRYRIGTIVQVHGIGRFETTYL